MGVRKLGLQIVVKEDEAQAEGSPRAGDYGRQDGYQVHLQMDRMGGEALIELAIRRGMAPATVVGLLREIADAIESHGPLLLNRPQDLWPGWLQQDGSVAMSPEEYTGDIPEIE